MTMDEVEADPDPKLLERSHPQVETTQIKPGSSRTQARAKPSPAIMNPTRKGGEKLEKPGDIAASANQSFQELNFDSMLSEAGSGSSDFGLNLNLSHADMENQAFFTDSNFFDSNTDNGQTKGQGGSIRSLLPGLESYAAEAAGDDFSGELQMTDDRTSRQPVPQKQTTEEDVVVLGESSFDDLFLEKDHIDRDGNENMLGGEELMDIGDLDSWFG
jgi:hypothetical protein